MTGESRADAAVHGFWKWGTSHIFDMQTFNLDSGSYLCQTYVKALSAEEKEKKDKYIHTCLEHSHNFTPMVYSVDRNPSAEAVSVQLRLAYMKQ